MFNLSNKAFLDTHLVIHPKSMTEPLFVKIEISNEILDTNTADLILPCLSKKNIFS